MRYFFTVLATAVGFGAGVFASSWMQRHQPVPAPPIGLMGEIRDVPLSGTGMPPRHHGHTPAELQAELERMKPEIEAFRQKVEPIRMEFRQNLEAVLSAEQKERLKVLSERWNAGSTNGQPAPSPERGPHGHDGLESIFPIVLVSNTLEHLTDDLKLDEAQQTTVRNLLVQRRAKFLDLVDRSPPPSLRLGRMAPRLPTAVSK